MNPAKPDSSKNDCRAKGSSRRFAAPSFFSSASNHLMTFRRNAKAFLNSAAREGSYRIRLGGAMV